MLKVRIIIYTVALIAALGFLVMMLSGTTETDAGLTEGEPVRLSLLASHMTVAKFERSLYTVDSLGESKPEYMFTIERYLKYDRKGKGGGQMATGILLKDEDAGRIGRDAFGEMKENDLYLLGWNELEEKAGEDETRRRQFTAFKKLSAEEIRELEEWER